MLSVAKTVQHQRNVLLLLMIIMITLKFEKIILQSIQDV
jgi:hypothetical protein